MDTNPGGQGDTEMVAEIVQKHQTKACDVPLKINVRKTGTTDKAKTITTTHTQSFKIGQEEVSGSINGFSCKNADQLGDQRCSDYQIQLCCPRKLSVKVYLSFNKLCYENVRNKYFYIL